MGKKKVAIIGGGAAALMVATQLNTGYAVHIYEKGKTTGRKFLVAGNGGFNLTNSALGVSLYQQYTAHPTLLKSLENFDSQATRAWLKEMDVPTFVGSSGRVFPEKGIKPIHVLQNIKQRLAAQNVSIHCKHEFVGFNEQQQPLIRHQRETTILEADYYIFALGGASWSVTGANDLWKAYFEEINVPTKAFEASNCGVNLSWNAAFIKQYEGSPLKNIALKVNQQYVKGEALITNYGLEGNAIYPIIKSIRSQLNTKKAATLYIDLKPNNDLEKLLQKVQHKSIKPKNYAYELKLSKPQLALAKQFTDKTTFLNSSQFVRAIKQLPIPVQSLRPIEEAISTVGGIALEAIHSNFSLRQYPNMFVIGEMLDWDAPTGGFLLQGCFSTAVTVAHTLNQLNP